MGHLHQYKAATHWVGNRGSGTSDYKSYDRNHDITIDGKQPLLCSSDPNFRGDKTRHNPEELLVASLSGCHMLWYLHLCAVNGIVVIEYADEASGKMEENQDGSGQFIEVLLTPKVTVLESSMIEKANALHHEANKMCFIARSVKFPVKHQPTARVSAVKSV
jgi:organic hydroperoxide reductase OsmC/OhrA